MANAPAPVFYTQLVREIRRGRVTPFLGAGVNLCGRPEGAVFKVGEWLPSGLELAQHLAQVFAYPPELPIDLLRVTQWVAVTLGNSALYDELHDIFDWDYRPTEMHRTMASLPAFVEREKRPEYPLIITTNYDDALERALTEAGVDFDLLTYIAAGTDQGKFRHRQPGGMTTVIRVPRKYGAVSLAERTLVVKIHGAVQRRALDQDSDSYVVTEDDYIDCLTRTDIVELLPSTVVDRMRHCHYLFLGYSLKDWNLRAMLHRIRRDQALRTASWVVQPNPEELEEKAWRYRNVDTLNITLEKFSTALNGLLSPAQTDASGEGQLAAS
jgi:SIR2-like domain